MKIEFIFDTTCPWCYMGKVRLARALRARPQITAAIRWTSFLLNPQMPLDGVPRQAYLERKLGGPARVQRLANAVQAVCQAEKVPLNLSRQLVAPNTVHSHRFIKFASGYGLAVPAVDTIFQAYFNYGVDIGDVDELLELGEDLDLPEIPLAQYLYSDQDVAAVLSDNARAHRLGVGGVPCVIFNDRFAITGAQETDILIHMLDLALENHDEKVSVQSPSGV